jgi:hypothetical protein
MTSARSRLLLAAGIGAPLVIAATSVLVALAWPGYDPVRRSISSLANAPLGFLQTLGFAVAGLLEAAFALGAAAVIGRTRRERRLVAALLLLIATLTLLFALFPTDPPGAPRSPVGRAHLGIALVYSLVLPAVCIVVARVLRRDDRWAPRDARGTLLTGVVMLVTFPVLVAAVSGPLRPWLGLVERGYFLIPAVWQAMVARRALAIRG